jgi:chromosome partitioning protein
VTFDGDTSREFCAGRLVDENFVAGNMAAALKDSRPPDHIAKSSVGALESGPKVTDHSGAGRDADTDRETGPAVGDFCLELKSGVHRSHFVLIPSQVSTPDVKAAMKTVAQIDDAQELARVPIARAMVWTRILPGFESVPVRQVRGAVEETGDIRIFKTALMERAAFRDIHISGMVPRVKDPTGGPAGNVAALTGELRNRSPGSRKRQNGR